MSRRRASVPRLAAAVVLLLAGAVVAVAVAREFRSFVAIPVPGETALEGSAVAALQPVDRALVEQAVYALAEAWNGGNLDPLLGESFTDRQRLLDLLAELVPRDARLTVLGIEGVSTLEQRVAERPEGSVLLSTVSAVVRTQVEFTDPLAGYLRLEGRNELYFEVEQPLLDDGGDAAGG